MKGSSIVRVYEKKFQYIFRCRKLEMAENIAVANQGYQDFQQGSKPQYAKIIGLGIIHKMNQKRRHHRMYTV